MLLRASGVSPYSPTGTRDRPAVFWSRRLDRREVTDNGRRWSDTCPVTRQLASNTLKNDLLEPTSVTMTRSSARRALATPSSTTLGAIFSDSTGPTAQPGREPFRPRRRPSQRELEILCPL